MPPLTPASTLCLFDRDTCATTFTQALDHFETVLCISTVSLEISEITHERQDLICVGTALLRGEDLPTMGKIHIYAIVDVVPEPEHPETGKALKLVAKEEVRGAVTALSGVGTQGFLLVAMGQKVMVRGLKEDGTVLPVAFMDVQCYVSVARELGPIGPDSVEGTGLCLIGDAVKGVWLAGYMVRDDLPSTNLATVSLQRSAFVACRRLTFGTYHRRTLTNSACLASLRTPSRPSLPTSCLMVNSFLSLWQMPTVTCIFCSSTLIVCFPRTKPTLHCYEAHDILHTILPSSLSQMQQSAIQLICPNHPLITMQIRNPSPAPASYITPPSTQPTIPAH